MKALLPIILLLSLVAPAKADFMFMGDIGMSGCEDFIQHYEAWKKNSNSYKGAIYKAYVYGSMNTSTYQRIWSSVSGDEVLFFVGLGSKKYLAKAIYIEPSVAGCLHAALRELSEKLGYQ